MYKRTRHGNFHFLKNLNWLRLITSGDEQFWFGTLSEDWFLGASCSIAWPVIFVLYFKKWNPKGRNWLLAVLPGVWVLWGRSSRCDGPQPTLVGSLERNSVLLSSENTRWWAQQHWSVMWVSGSPRVQWQGDTGPGKVSVSGNIILGLRIYIFFS